jgi:hypothetical protein
MPMPSDPLRGPMIAVYDAIDTLPEPARQASMKRPTEKVLSIF